MRGKYTAIDKDILIKTYEENGRSMRATGKSLGVPDKTIMRRMKEYGIEWDKKPHYLCNENFFDDLNEKSMYWLGFIVTDGWVHCHKKTNSRTLSIKLSQKDYQHLVNFKNNIDSTSPIFNLTENKSLNGNEAKDYYSCQLTITSKHIYDRLHEFNINNNKTYNYNLPETIINSDKLSHFIRGCIDGDGWFREHKNNGKSYTTEIRVGMCGYPPFIKQLFDILKKETDISGGSYYVRKSGNTADFEFSSKSEVNKIVNYLYKDATIYLPRKYDLAMQAKKFI